MEKTTQTGTGAGFNWICTDADGSIYLYENEPCIVDDSWYAHGLIIKYADQDYASFDDWKESCLYIGP